MPLGPIVTSSAICILSDFLLLALSLSLSVAQIVYSAFCIHCLFLSSKIVPRVSIETSGRTIEDRNVFVGTSCPHKTRESARDAVSTFNHVLSAIF